MESIDELETYAYGTVQDYTTLINLSPIGGRSQSVRKLKTLIIYHDHNWIYGLDFLYESEGKEEFV